MTLKLWLADLAKGVAARRRARPAARRARAVADARRGPAVVAVGVGRVDRRSSSWCWRSIRRSSRRCSTSSRRCRKAPTRERIEALLARCGFADRGLFVMDGSRRSSHGNAFFTGFGRGRRIVFFDTLLSRLAPDEIEAVLAHELGHFKLQARAEAHAVDGRAVARVPRAARVADGLALVLRRPRRAAGAGPPRRRADPVLPRRCRCSRSCSGRSSSLYSRKHEFEADAFAARHASAAALVQALVKLYEDNAATLTPDPLHSAFYDSHPTAAVRIARLSSAGTGTGPPPDPAA